MSPLAFENREYESPTVGSSFFYSLAVGEIALRAGAQVTHTPIHETTQIQQLCFIEGISHFITPDNWLTTVAFSSAAAYQNVGIALFDGLYEKAGFFDVTRWGW